MGWQPLRPGAAAGWDLWSLACCFPVPSPVTRGWGWARSFASSVSVLPGVPEPRDVWCPVSLPRARPRCRRCISGVCHVTACTYICLLLSPALCCASSPSPLLQWQGYAPQLSFPPSAPHPVAYKTRSYRASNRLLHGWRRKPVCCVPCLSPCLVQGGVRCWGLTPHGAWEHLTIVVVVCGEGLLLGLAHSR